MKISKYLKYAALLLLLVTAATPLFSQVLSFGTPERDTTTEIGGQSGRIGVGAANFNNELWVAYIGLTAIDSKGDAYVYTAENSNGGINYGDKAQVTVSGDDTVAANSNPALAVFNGQLYLSYIDGYGNAYFVVSPDGYSWGSTLYSCNPGGQYIFDSSPTMAVFGSDLYVGLRDDQTHAMVICQIASNNSVTVTEFPSITLNFNPGLGTFNGLLYAAIETQDNSHTIYFYTSPDGLNWTLQTGASQDQTSTAPSLAVHDGILYMGFRSNDSSNNFLYKYSTDGINFSNSIKPNFAIVGDPVLLEATNLTGSPYQGDLYVYWGSNTGAPNYLCSDQAE